MMNAQRRQRLRVLTDLMVKCVTLRAREEAATHAAHELLDELESRYGVGVTHVSAADQARVFRARHEMRAAKVKIDHHYKQWMRVKDEHAKLMTEMMDEHRSES